MDRRGRPGVVARPADGPDLGVKLAGQPGGDVALHGGGGVGGLLVGEGQDLVGVGCLAGGRERVSLRGGDIDDLLDHGAVGVAVGGPQLADGGVDGGAEAAPPRLAITVVLLVLVGFVVCSALGVEIVWPALAGVVVLLVRRLVAPSGGRDGAVRELAGVLRAANPLFLLFVLALGIVVRGAVDHGLAALADAVLPDGTSLPTVIGIAVLAAVAANLVNNLPATLMLVPLTAPLGPVAVLAVLVGVNIGPNLTYVGSLATLLWRRVLVGQGARSGLREFTRLGLMVVPVSLVACATVLWAAARVLGV